MITLKGYATFVRVVVIIPEPPLWVYLRAVNTTALEVTWSASNYTSYYQITCNSCNVSASTNETVYVIGQLVPGTNYAIAVAACADLCSDAVSGTNNTGTSHPESCLFLVCYARYC